MLSFREWKLLNEEVTQSQLAAVVKTANQNFSKFGILLHVSPHFFERTNDNRNKPVIDAAELEDFFMKVKTLHAKRLASMKVGDEGLIKNTKTNLTIPYVIKWDNYLKFPILMCKTIMRKAVYGNDNFHGDNETLTVR